MSAVGETGLRWSGVIEGFYGRPWSDAQRSRLFARMRDWGMNMYLYAPKDDRWHRQKWREPYPEAEARQLAALADAARPAGVRFVYALAPGLDLDWSKTDDRNALIGKFRQVADLGIQDFAVLFDDIPYAGDRAAQARTQVEVTHLVMDTLWRERQPGVMLFCPTEYCAERARPTVSESHYLAALGQHLRPEVDIFWTGPEVVSKQIDVEGIKELGRVLRRKPLIWDNLHASDYTLHRLHLGPYAGRPLELRELVAGILSNPNTPFEPNFPGLASLADYARAGSGWNPQDSLERALRAWLPEFNQVDAFPVTLEELQLLADMLYLPGALGPRATRILDTARNLAAGQADREHATAELLGARRQLLNVLRALEAGPNRELLFDLHPYLVDALAELYRLNVQFGTHAGEDTPNHRGSLATELMKVGERSHGR